MNEQVKTVIGRYAPEIGEMFTALRALIYDSAPREPEEKMWAGMPSYYVGEAFARLIPFRDHINIEAAAIKAHQMELGGYQITPKGMMQIYLRQEIPCEILKTIFAETLK